jgi:hypothetical protein
VGSYEGPRSLRLEAQKYTESYYEGHIDLPTLTEEATQAALPLLDAKVHVHTHGPLVETCITLDFKNTRPEDIEGALECPLPPGAFVSAFASMDPVV